MPREAVICSMGSAFRIGIFRVEILKPSCTVELPSSPGIVEGGGALAPGRIVETIARDEARLLKGFSSAGIGRPILFVGASNR